MVNKSLGMRKMMIVREISRIFQKLNFIQTVKIYGSWLRQDGVDIDIAIIINNAKNGIVPASVYNLLLDIRQQLMAISETDTDLICHSEDEVDDIRSPLWHPRYNPSLISGLTIKGKFPISACSLKNTLFSYADICACTLFDHRTLCRRQMLRPFNQGSAEFILNKFLHGPANAITYYYCQHHKNLPSSMPDIIQSFLCFDNCYSTCSKRALERLSVLKDLNFEIALPFMNWYESLISFIFGRSSQELYLRACEKLP